MAGPQGALAGGQGLLGQRDGLGNAAPGRPLGCGSARADPGADAGRALAAAGLHPSTGGDGTLL